MGRDNRTIDPLLPYHAGSRGSNRGLIAWDHHDYASIVGEIARAARRHRWAVYAWCVLPNHYHLVLRMPRGGFSVGFQQINGNHSRRTNRRYGRCAHLFENRPWSVELTSDVHVAAAVAYALRNPIAANLCKRAEDWPYSSYRATVGLEEAPTWLALDEVLPVFGSDNAEAINALSNLVHWSPALVSDTNY